MAKVTGLGGIFFKSGESEFGRFGWIVDPEGTRIELRQPPARAPRWRRLVGRSRRQHLNRMCRHARHLVAPAARHALRPRMHPLKAFEQRMRADAGVQRALKLQKLDQPDA